MIWQRRARFVVAMIGLACVAVVGVQFKRRPAADGPGAVTQTDPRAVVVTGPGSSSRISLNFKHGVVSFDSYTTYDDNSSRMTGVTVVTERAGRTYTITGDQAYVGAGESNMSLEGEVRVTSSDGLTVRMQRATYNDGDGVVEAPGPVAFTRGRMSGSATGLVYNKSADLLKLLENVSIQVTPDRADGEAVNIQSGVAEFNRPQKTVQFTGGMKAVRPFETIEAEAANGQLTEDEQGLARLELRGRSRITGSRAGAGAMRVMAADDIDLDYSDDGDAIEHARLRGSSIIQVAGDAPARGRSPSRARPGPGGRAAVTASPHRQIAASALDLSMAPDGSTPTMILANDRVELTIPGDGESPSRVVVAQGMDARGEEGKGLTTARFSGGVQFTERDAKVVRVARSETLDATLAPGLGGIEEARFARGVTFEEGAMRARAAAATYVLDRGTLQLRGTEPGTGGPRMQDDRMVVTASSIDVTLEGPLIKATGNVKTELLPAKKGSRDSDDPKVPSMLKEDQPVNVTAGALNYDGDAAKATFSGEALLWQGETRIKAATIAIDDKTGDLTASGGVTTDAMLIRETKDKRKEREKATGSAKDFRYQEADRRAIYAGGARLVGLQGDLTAERIELYLKPSGDEIDRAVGDGKVTFAENKRKATGDHFKYFTSPEERYELTGKPMTIVDECGQPTSGLMLIYFRATDRMQIDGGDVTRTQTRGSGNSCP